MARASSTSSETHSSVESRESRSTTSDRKSGTLVGGRYRLIELLGQGAMGEVWRARHEELNVDVAVKFAEVREGLDSERMLERFRFESQVTAQLGARTHCIVAAQDAGKHRNVPYLVMELVRGRSLDALLAHGRMPIELVVELVEQVASALEVAHGAGIWHRDVKPANVMVSGWDGARTTGAFEVKLADFGVAKELARHLDVESPRTTRMGMLVGSPAYMSPEQLTGATVDHRADLWSLAVTAYEAMTGRIPFDGEDTKELVLAICKKPFEPVAGPGLPEAIDGWLTHALAKDPAERFGSAGELARSLRRAVAPALATERPPEPRRSPAALAVAAAAVATASLATLLLAMRAREAPEPAARAASTSEQRQPTGEPAEAIVGPSTPAAAASSAPRAPAPIARLASEAPSVTPSATASAAASLAPAPSVAPLAPPAPVAPRPSPSFDRGEIH